MISVKCKGRRTKRHFTFMMAVLRFALLVALVGLCHAGGKRRYDGYKVLRVIPNDIMELQSLRSLRETFPGELDFWSEPKQPGHPVDVMVGPGELSVVRNVLEDNGLTFSTMIEDVQRIDDEAQIEPIEQGISSKFRYDIFHDYNEIEQWIYDMATEFSSIMSVDKLGHQSYKGHDIKLLKIGKPGSNKPIFWWQSGTHPREWLSSATTIKIVYKLASDYQKGDPEIVKLLDSVDFYIMPIFNPDGYIQTRNTDRLWRKNMRPSDHQYWCTGADLNRNFDEHWSESGTSVNPCSEIYHGDSAGSEIEVQALTAYLSTLTNMKVYIDMHAYSQFWMIPYGYTEAPPPNYNEQLKLADKAMAALKGVSGKHFETGSIANVIYRASGSSIDWVYNNLGTQYCFAPELRDKGVYGFLAPSSEINPSANEVYAAIKVIGNEIIP